MQPPPRSFLSVKEKNVMKNLSKNIFSTAGLLAVIGTSTFSIAQETTPSISGLKVTTASQSFKKIRQNKSLALSKLKRGDLLPSQSPTKMKGQYLVHDALPSDSFTSK